MLLKPHLKKGASVTPEDLLTLPSEMELKPKVTAEQYYNSDEYKRIAEAMDKHVAAKNQK